MATYRYWDVRQDIYRHCANTPLKRVRTFNEMRRLFKWSYWAILICMLVCMLSVFILVFCFPRMAYLSLIPGGIVLLLSVVSELLSDKMYNPSERQKELDERATCLNEYVLSIHNILVSHGITTKEHRDFLRQECKSQLEKHGKSYESVSSRTFEMLISVPLGALVSALIYKSESADVVIAQIVFLLLLGLAALGVAHTAKKVTFYSEGHFKDQFLLQALSELSYYSAEELMNQE